MYDKELRRQAIQMLDAGKTSSSVAESLNLPESTVQTWRKRYGGKVQLNVGILDELTKMEASLRQASGEILKSLDDLNSLRYFYESLAKIEGMVDMVNKASKRIVELKAYEAEAMRRLVEKSVVYGEGSLVER